MTNRTTAAAVDHEIIDEYVEWLELGKTTRDFCRQPGYPKRSTLKSWMREDEDVSDRIARAREDGLEEMHEEILAIADNMLSGDEVTEELIADRDEDGEPRRDASDEIKMVSVNTKIKRADALGHRKFQVESRRKHLATCDPATYGEKRNVDISGALSIEQLVLEAAAEIEAEDKADTVDTEELFG